MEIKDNAFLRQFEVVIDGQLLTIEYSNQEKKIFLTKLGLPEGFSDEEISNNFIKNVLNLIEEKNLRVVPTASKIVSFFRKNPSYKSMLPPGIII